MASQPHPVDVYVGSRVRLRRTLLGMSQQKLAEAIGLTFQQVQKYEKGANRIGSSRLYQMSKVLDVAIAYFFEEFRGPASIRQPGLAEAPPVGYRHDPLVRRETLELVRAYYKITNPSVRKRLFDLTKSLAEISDQDAGNPKRRRPRKSR
jgi:transcriptional regulator with XRE-family HTH domain